MMSERSPEIGVARSMGIWKLRPKSQVLYRTPGIGSMGSLVFTNVEVEVTLAVQLDSRRTLN